MKKKKTLALKAYLNYLFCKIVNEKEKKFIKNLIKKQKI